MNSEQKGRATIFYDSLCPLCNFEVSFLKHKNKEDRIRFIDIADPSFDPSQYQKKIDDFVGTIHGLSRRGEIVKGMDVFVEIYDALGWGWVYRWTRWPFFKTITDFAYMVFAKIRPRFSRFRPSCRLDQGYDRCK